jgi:signal transduction histidine kinase
LDVLGSERAFRPEEVQLCENFAAQMGVAIERARMYEQARQVAVDLAQLERANQERAHFIDLLEHQHLNIPGFALSALDLVLQGDLGQVNLNDRQLGKLEKARDELRRYKRFQESLRQSGHPYSGGRMPERESLTIQALIDETVSVLHSDAEAKGVFLQIECATERRTRANFDMLFVALTHIIENAIKFSAPGGLVHIRASAQADWIQITVDDQGCGVEAKFRINLGDLVFAPTRMFQEWAWAWRSRFNSSRLTAAKFSSRSNASRVFRWSCVCPPSRLKPSNRSGRRCDVHFARD